MLESVFSLVWFLCGLAFEVMVFIVIEKATIGCLADPRYSSHKQAIWALECAVLFPACAIIYFHHFPYFLFAMACIGFSYSLVMKHTDFGNYWRAVRTTWQDFIDYSESIMGHHNGSPAQEDDASGQPPVFQSQANAVPVGPILSASSSASPAGGGGALPPDQIHPDVYAVPNAPTSPVLLRNQSVGSQQSSERKVASSVPIVDKPASPKKGDSGGPPDRASIGVSSGATDFICRFPGQVKTWLNQTLGRDCSIPPGLVNRTQENLCFVNCIIQTLSRSPQLTPLLEQALESDQARLTLGRVAFLREVIDLFHNLTVPGVDPSTGQLSYPKTLNTRSLRLAISVNCPFDLLQHPLSGIPQEQQDAAEFLSWFVETLHCALRVPPAAGPVSIYARPGIHNPPVNPFPHPAPSNSAQASLELLRAAYNYPTTDTINIYRQRCHQELANANGQDQSTYIHLVTRLSSLDWLLYKEQNNSIVDDLFTGQHVSASFCLNCGHISVTTDIFRSLMLPIPMSRDTITILNCFNELIKLENLTQLSFDSCKCLSNIPGSTNSPTFQTSTPNGPMQRRSSSAPNSPGMGSMLSPINGQLNRDQNIGPPSFMASTPMSYNPPHPTNVSCQRQTSFQRLPDCLVVQLIRFSLVENKAIKLETRIQVSVDLIDLSPLILVRQTFREPMMYSLYGLCIHADSSSVQSGHYYAYSIASDGQWYLFNDSNVNRVDIRHELNRRVVQENVYLLYYRRVGSTVQS